MVTHRSQQQAPEGTEPPRTDDQKSCTPAGFYEGNGWWVFARPASDDHLRRYQGDTRQRFVTTVWAASGTPISGEDVRGAAGEHPDRTVELGARPEGLAGGPVERQIRSMRAVDSGHDRVGVGPRIAGPGLLVGSTDDGHGARSVGQAVLTHRSEQKGLGTLRNRATRTDEEIGTKKRPRSGRTRSVPCRAGA